MSFSREPRFDLDDPAARSARSRLAKARGIDARRAFSDDNVGNDGFVF
jgi:hypothetical protein